MSDHSPSLSAHPQIAGVTLFAAPPGLHEHAVHAHEAYSVIAVVSGAKRFFCDGQAHEVHSGEIAVANPGQLHGCEPLNGQAWSHRTWYLSRALVDELALSLGRAGPQRLRAPKISDRPLWHALNAAHAGSADDGELLDRQSSALEALAELVERHGHGSAATPSWGPGVASAGAQERFQAGVAWMQANPGAAVDLGGLAQAVNISPSQLMRDFRLVCGTTPAVYWRQWRLARARDLINGGASLLEATLATGFTDQSHFTRCFRSAYGVTPGQFAELARSVPGNAPF